MKVIVFYLSLIFAALINFVLFIPSKFLSHKFAVLVIKLFGDGVFESRKDYDVYKKQVINKGILVIPSYGCAHYFNNGGCSMCGFCKEIEKYKFRHLHPKAITVLTKIFLIYLEQLIDSGKTKIDTLTIFMAGSFLNKEELSAEAQNEIIFFFAKKIDCQRLIIESRPEYIIKYEAELEKFKRIVGDKKIEISIGLESSNLITRNVLIKKGFSNEQYSESVKIAKKHGFIVNTYILIGVPDLSKKQIIDEPVESAKFALGKGSDIVSFETYCSQVDTPWAELYMEGRFESLDLWCIVEVILGIDAFSSNWYLGEFSDWPKPIAIPTNCDKCTNQVMMVLDDLRKTHNTKVLNNLPSCPCRAN